MATRPCEVRLPLQCIIDWENVCPPCVRWLVVGPHLHAPIAKSSHVCSWVSVDPTRNGVGHRFEILQIRNHRLPAKDGDQLPDVFSEHGRSSQSGVAMSPAVLVNRSLVSPARLVGRCPCGARTTTRLGFCGVPLVKYWSLWGRVGRPDKNFAPANFLTEPGRAVS
jgi:hypothetical protein